MNNKTKDFFNDVDSYYIQQLREWGEIVFNIETVNRYEILNSKAEKVGFMAEKSGGFITHLLRWVLRAHRPMEIEVLNQKQEQVLCFKRPFYWFWSDLSVIDSAGEKIGSIQRKFSIINKFYHLCDSNGKKFATIKSPVWRLWSFPVYDLTLKEIGRVSKNWGGMLQEIFTDADKFHVNFPSWNEEQKSVLLAAAISIDMDYFENNARNSINT
jgi:uncharacterized protein YxjI